MQKKSNLKWDGEETSPEINMGADIKIDKKNENEQNNIRHSTHRQGLKLRKRTQISRHDCQNLSAGSS